MRTGLFGGSFNPIHFGHLRAAEEVREALGLDLVYFIPAALPPHKPGDTLAAADHRLHMVQLATKGNRHFMVSDSELKRAGRSYTVDTIRHFIATMRGRPELYLLLGTDQFMEFETWRECDEIMRLCNLAVHYRPRAGETDSDLSLAAVNRFGYVKEGEHYTNRGGRTLSVIPTTFLPISATMIRGKLALRKSIRYLVPGDVADYIERHSLYL
ncbi:MAG TPA: nicotinate-nucleotide adenylyltransferase [Candidatus Binataceae bacterium]|jgi:nicotinate-nucleotide adenylyltransferase|nr:nicotinate-nucleotide adenylyltransferase [Candidatus Binataceae bacterium]